MADDPITPIVPITPDHPAIDDVDNTNDIARFILSLLAAVKLLAGALGYNFFTDELAHALENLVPLLVVLWGVWRNNYVTRKGKAQKLVLEQNDLVAGTDLVKK